MLNRKRPFTLLPARTMLLLLVGLTLVSSGSVVAQKRGNSSTPTEAPRTPPTVVLDADTAYVTVCARASAQTPPTVRLKATTENFSTGTLRYTYTTTGGRIVGDGANPTWDLSGMAPGTYTTSVEVDNGLGRECVAFASVKAIVNECPPPRPLCPNVVIYCPDTVALGQPVTFTANLSGGTPGSITPVYNWKVSAGRIISGQGTSSIQVDTAGLGGQALRATVEVGGYDLNCTAVCTTQVPDLINPVRFDEYPDVRFNDEKARLDNFAVRLQTEPSARGYIVAYGSRRGRVDEGRVRAGRTRDYLVNERGINSSRIIVLDGGYQEQLSVELWLVPPGATAPKPRPGVTHEPAATTPPRRPRRQR
ncbi:MAG: hypothetical protein H0W76_01265 [Pyrinomonadaceae bacterium]|nr:hypothetical protein [Pyrinomonadaceae bacterium]